MALPSFLLTANYTKEITDVCQGIYNDIGRNVTQKDMIKAQKTEKKAPKNGMDTDCICRVEEVSSLITGLETGKEYTFDYAGSPRIKPFTFVFEKGLFLVKD